MKNCYIARSPMVAARQLGGEMVIMSAADSTLFTLNEVASLIWKSADGATPLWEIVNGKVCAEFDVDPEIALADAERLVGELADRGLLLLTNGPARPSPVESERSL
jgi:Coenzyme PQQ synthesis protein D (PqqD)